jgi:c-di-GMP-binding flagellar brake protein YcgR
LPFAEYVLQYRQKALSQSSLTPFKEKHMKTAANKRTEERYNCFVPVEGKNGSEFDETKTVDISRHGIGFLSAHAIPLNQKIAVEISLKPNTEPVLVVGVVKWVRKIEDSDQYRIGMTFSEIISGSSTRLDKYFSSNRLEEQKEG